MGLAQLLALSFTSSEEACSEEWQTIVDRHWPNDATATSFRLSQSEHATKLWLEIHWLSWFPWTTKIAMDKRSEFAAEVRNTLKNECGFDRKTIASRNPQSNSTIERCHKTLLNMICSAQIADKRDQMSSLVSKAFWQHVGKP